MIRLRHVKWKKCYRRAACREWLEAQGAKIEPYGLHMGPADGWWISW
jgi:hypothetical protein